MRDNYHFQPCINIKDTTSPKYVAAGILCYIGITAQSQNAREIRKAAVCIPLSFQSIYINY